MVRVLGLAEAGTHAIVAAALGSWGTSERTLIPQLLPAISEASVLGSDNLADLATQIHQAEVAEAAAQARVDDAQARIAAWISTKADSDQRICQGGCQDPLLCPALRWQSSGWR